MTSRARRWERPLSGSAPDRLSHRVVRHAQGKQHGQQHRDERQEHRLAKQALVHGAFREAPGLPAWLVVARLPSKLQRNRMGWQRSGRWRRRMGRWAADRSFR